MIVSRELNVLRILARHVSISDHVASQEKGWRKPTKIQRILRRGPIAEASNQSGNERKSTAIDPDGFGFQIGIEALDPQLPADTADAVSAKRNG